MKIKTRVMRVMVRISMVKKKILIIEMMTITMKKK